MPLLALTAFAVDMGYIVLIQSDLQNAADSAALAGANKLPNGFVQYNLPGQSSSNQSSVLNSSESSRVGGGDAKSSPASTTPASPA